MLHSARNQALLQAARKRVGQFLLTLLSLATHSRYERAFKLLWQYCSQHFFAFGALNEEQDLMAADWVLDLQLNGDPIQLARDGSAGAQKLNAGLK